MVKTANEIFRDFETDGVPSSGTHKPIKADIRKALTATVPAVDDDGMIVDEEGIRSVKPFAEVRSKLGMVKSILDFSGAYGNGIDYDDAAFTAAAKSDYAIYLPKRTFVFSDGYKCTVPIDKFGKVFFGDSGGGTEYDGYSSVIKTNTTGTDTSGGTGAAGGTEYDGYSAVIKTNTTGTDTSGGTGAAAFEFLCSQGKLINISFLHTGRAKDSSACAVRFDREATGINTDDIDSVVENCQFTNYGVAIRQNGRGIDLINSLAFNTDELLVWSFPTTGTEGDAIQSDSVLGSRAFNIIGNIIGNRIHNGSNLVRQTGSANMRGALISNNDADLGDCIFTGGLEDSIVANNVCRFSTGRAGPGVYITAGGHYVQVIGGLFYGGNLDGSRSGTNGVEFNTGADVIGAIVSKVTCRNLGGTAVSFSNSRPVQCEISGVIGEGLGRDYIDLGAGSLQTNIIGGQARNIGLEGTSRGVLRLTGSHQRLNAALGQWNPVAGTARNVLMISTPTLTKCQITLNQSTYSTLVTNGYTDGAGNVLTGNVL